MYLDNLAFSTSRVLTSCCMCSTSVMDNDSNEEECCVEVCASVRTTTFVLAGPVLSHLGHTRWMHAELLIGNLVRGHTIHNILCKKTRNN